jgi:hypothetical protein
VSAIERTLVAGAVLAVLVVILMPVLVGIVRMFGGLSW